MSTRCSKDVLNALTARNHLPRAIFDTEAVSGGFTSYAQVRVSKQGAETPIYVKGWPMTASTKRAAEQFAAEKFVAMHGNKPKEFWSSVKAAARRQKPEERSARKRAPRQFVRHDRGENWAGRPAAQWGT